VTLRAALAILATLTWTGFAIAPGPKYAHADPPTIEKLITDEVGPIVSEREAPQLIRMLEQMGSDLAASQARLAGPDAPKTTHKLLLVDTPVVNAFVQTSRDKIPHNTIVVTTGLLKHLFEKLPGSPTAENALKGIIIRMAGIIGHEFGHPLDKLPGEGLEGRHGMAASQNVEIKADITGTLIAQDAGYPHDSVLLGLQAVLGGEGRKAGTFDIATSTHPQRDTRLSALSLFLTGQRYEKPPAKSRRPGPMMLRANRAIQGELAGIRAYERSRAYNEPATLLDAIKRLNSLLDHAQESKGAAYRDYQETLSHVDAWIERKGGKLTPEESAAFYAFIEKHFIQVGKHWNSGGIPANTDKLRKLGSKRNSHYAHMAGSGFYNSPEHRARIAGILSHGKASQTLSEADYSWILADLTTRFLPPKVAVAEYGEKIIQKLKQELGKKGETRIWQNVTNDADSDLSPYLSELLHSRRKEFTIAEWTRLNFSESVLDTPDPTFPITSSPEDSRKGAPGILHNRQKLALRSDGGDAVDAFRRSMAEIWENRGYYGTLDILRGRQETDWRTVMAALDIDPKQGFDQLRQTVKVYVGTPEAAEMIQAFDQDVTNFKIRHYRMNSVGRPSWLTPSFEATLSTHPTLRSSFYGTFPEIRRKRYREGLHKEITQAITSGKPLNLDELKRIHQKLVDEFPAAWTFHNYFLEVAQEIDRAKFPSTDKRRLLEDVYLRKYVQRNSTDESNSRNFGEKTYTWDIEKEFPTGLLSTTQMTTWSGESPATKRQIAEILIHNGAVASHSDLLSKLHDPKQSYLGRTRYLEFARDAMDYGPQLRAELDQNLARARSPEQRAQQLIDFARLSLDPSGDGYLLDSSESAKVGAHKLREYAEHRDHLLALAENVAFSRQQAIEFFKHLTATGSNAKADAFFEKRILPDLGQDPAHTETLKTWGWENRFHGEALQAQIARITLAQEIEDAVLGRRMQFDNNDKPTVYKHDPAKALDHLLFNVEKHVRNKSSERDRLLDEIAWKLPRFDLEQSRSIEKLKTREWRTTDPYAARKASVIGDYVSDMSPTHRKELLKYLVDPGHVPFPDSVREKFRADLVERQRTNRLTKEEINFTDPKTRADELAWQATTRIIGELTDATQFEKIPAIHMLLSAGKNELGNAPDYPDNIIRDQLGYARGSNEEKLLKAFLNVIPEHEKLATLSYLLSLGKGDQGKNVAKLFEVFQTVGIKFGQMSSIWQLFGPEIAEQTRHLKGNAEPLSKFEIETLLKQTLSEAELAKIDHLSGVLGSASMKTVVGVKLKDGREVALLVQRPNAPAQIDSNLELAGNFLNEARKLGVPVQEGMVDSVLKDLRGQLHEELKMSHEAPRIREAKKLYESYNSKLGKDLPEGWKVVVPDVLDEKDFKVRDNLLFVELAKGKTVANSSDSIKKLVGPAIDAIGVDTLFKQGWFNADSHAGNFTADPTTKTLYALDHGQAAKYYIDPSRWKADDPYLIAQFVRGFAKGDAPGLVNAAMKMARTESRPRDQAKLVRGIKRLLTNRALDGNQKLIEVVNALAGHGLQLEERFSFGALKGLMTLGGEQYETPQKFQDRVATSVTEKLKSKPGAYVRDCLESLMNGVASRVAPR
jgi:predicted unusual protein kinase regulating ubiquinone biosynthesis (AarF/ABC1/UbiB family)